MKIKYMGSADVRRIDKGEKFGGRLPDGLEATLEFTRENSFVVDTSELGLSEEALSLLLSEPDFKDVTDMKRVPVSMNEKIFGGLQDPVTAEDLAADPDADKNAAEVGDTKQTEPVTGKKSGSAGGGSGGGAGTTTVGGSTAGTGTGR